MSEDMQVEARALAAIRALVGRPVGAPSAAPDPVNQPMIRHWAAALQDHNPVYTDPAFAAASRFGGIVAPPLMLQTWTMPTPELTGIAERGGAPTAGAENPLTLLDDAGFIATLATNSEFEIVRYLRLGEVITSTMELESVSDKKRTRLGPGHFITWVTTYRDEQGAVVGRQTFRILKFKPDLEALLR
jgi:acyl dehydratase